MGGLPLGIQPDAPYAAADVALASGDWLVIFTDGVVEAENQHAEAYGEADVANAIGSRRNA